MSMTRRVFLIASLALAAVVILPGRVTGAEPASGGFKIIVHPANPATSIDRKELGRIFLRKAASWSSGERMLPVDQGVSTGVREGFSRVAHQKSARAVKNYWNQQIFSGKGVPPPEVSSDARVIAFVLANPGAIGYVAADATVGNAKILVVR
jgi:ABC-type phosphate transport system substrate-binding protein